MCNMRLQLKYTLWFNIFCNISEKMTSKGKKSRIFRRCGVIQINNSKKAGEVKPVFNKIEIIRLFFNKSN